VSFVTSFSSLSPPPLVILPNPPAQKGFASLAFFPAPLFSGVFLPTHPALQRSCPPALVGGWVGERNLVGGKSGLGSEPACFAKLGKSATLFEFDF
jgi:hypothetical protein